MPKQTYRVRNWKEYNKSLVNRGNITFWFSEAVIQNWYYTHKQKRGGVIKYSDIAIVCGLTLRNLFHLSLRATQGFIESLMRLTQLELETPNYSTLSRRATDLPVRLKTTTHNEPLHVVIDSTGINVYGESEWRSVKHGTYRYQVWRKLHLVMDVANHMILAADYSDSNRHDANYLGPLITAIDQVNRITGDGAYDKKKCYRAVYQKGIKLVTPPQHNAIPQQNKWKKDPALLARDQAIQAIQDLGGGQTGLKAWKQSNDYHQRSLVETAMFRLKSVFGDTVRSRKFENQKAELLIRCAALNKMTLLGMPKGEMIAI